MYWLFVSCILKYNNIICCLFLFLSMCICYILHLYLLFYYGTYYSISTIDLMYNRSKFWNKISALMVPILSQLQRSNPRLKILMIVQKT